MFPGSEYELIRGDGHNLDLTAEILQKTLGGQILAFQGLQIDPLKSVPV